MKRTESNTPIKTIPDGAYEAGTTSAAASAKQETTAAASSNNSCANDPGTDLQGNGYPTVENKSRK